ncbi:MAG: DUF167 domain-containing protein [Planctomycetota bacterium]|nr:MAG: DUF167 domain-containing protein [Planctomycetota bacterium]
MVYDPADLKLENHPEGIVLPVRAQPGARKNELRGVHQGALKVCVTQAPEKGKANKAIIAFLQKALGVRKSQIALVAGETASQKKFLIRDVAREELIRSIHDALNASR